MPYRDLSCRLGPINANNAENGYLFQEIKRIMYMNETPINLRNTIMKTQMKGSSPRKESKGKTKKKTK